MFGPSDMEFKEREFIDRIAYNHPVRRDQPSDAIRGNVYKWRRNYVSEIPFADVNLEVHRRAPFVMLYSGEVREMPPLWRYSEDTRPESNARRRGRHQKERPCLNRMGHSTQSRLLDGTMKECQRPGQRADVPEHRGVRVRNPRM